jgi:hypothetical protein
MRVKSGQPSLQRAEAREIAEAKAAKEADKRRAESINDGFTVALRMLSNCGAPAVGHNALYDCVFSIEKFLATLDG